MRMIFLMALLVSFAGNVSAQHTNKIFTADIDNFWTAYDSVQATNDTLKQAAFIQQMYLSNASAGLKEFMLARQHSAKRHLKNILKYPKFWVSLRPKTLQIKTYAPAIENIMLRFKTLYPEFKQPDVYFTIGCLNSGGTTTKSKILIGSEIAAADSTVDASELSKWLQGVFKDNRNVVYMVAHEAGHTQQRGNGANLLAYCIAEGACDFIAELVLEETIVSPYMTYGKANERALWEAFEKEMYGKDTKNWLYNGNTAPGGHADLGYFMGYSICKAYYDNAVDKAMALKQIIELDYRKETLAAFLTASKYPEKWKAAK
jgi:Predicted Zn-dependent protease (DUF2268)